MISIKKLGDGLMGGIGSGRRYSFDLQKTVNSCNSIDIHYLNRNGLLIPGHVIKLTWSEHGRKIAAVNGHITTEGLVLSYRVNGESINELIRIVETPCHYGGNRPWLQCPNCHRRVGKIYLKGKRFLCRLCYNLAYQSQRENASYRQLIRLKSIYKQLGGYNSLGFQIKPKGMHWKTYNLLRMEIEYREASMWAALMLRR
jgi:hypothetical protein